MIDHEKVLLLNVSASDAQRFANEIPWPTDPTFSAATLSGPLADFNDTLFSEFGSDMRSKVSMVEFLSALATSPGSSLLSVIGDSRTVARRPKVDTVFDFYSVHSDTAHWKIVGSALSGQSHMSIFTADGETPGRLASAMEDEQVFFYNSHDGVRRFSALLRAYILRLEAIRLRSVSRSVII